MLSWNFLLADEKKHPTFINKRKKQAYIPNLGQQQVIWQFQIQQKKAHWMVLYCTFSTLVFFWECIFMSIIDVYISVEITHPPVRFFPPSLTSWYQSFLIK